MVRKLAAATDGRVGRWRSIDLNVSPSGDTLCREPLPKAGDADVEVEVVLRLIVRLTTPHHWDHPCPGGLEICVSEATSQFHEQTGDHQSHHCGYDECDDYPGRHQPKFPCAAVGRV